MIRNIRLNFSASFSLYQAERYTATTVRSSFSSCRKFSKLNCLASSNRVNFFKLNALQGKRCSSSGSFVGEKGLSPSSINDKNVKVLKEKRTVAKEKKRPSKAKAQAISPMDQRVTDLIMSLETSFVKNRTKLDPQDIERCYRPKDKFVLNQKEHYKLSKSIVESFNLAQLRKYIAGFSPEKDQILNASSACQISLAERMHLKMTVTKNYGKEQLANHIIKLWGIDVLSTPIFTPESTAPLDFITEEEFPSNKHELYFLVCKGGEHLRRLELLGNAQIQINPDEESYTIRGDPSEIEKTKKMIRELLVYKTLDLDINEINCHDPNFLRMNGELIAGVAQTAGTYITAQPSPTGQRLIILALQEKDIKRTQQLLEEAWKLQHPPAPRAVLLHLPEALSKDGLDLFPSADPAYLPEFYQTHTMFHLRPSTELRSTLENIQVDSNALLLPHTIDKRLSAFSEQSRASIHLRDVPELLLQSARYSGFETQLEARFGHILNFNRRAFNYPGFYEKPSEKALQNMGPDSYFLPSFPRHRVWETLVPIQEASSIELEYVMWTGMGPSFFSDAPQPPTHAPISKSYHDASAYSRASLTSPVFLCVTLSNSDIGLKVVSARFSTAPVVADVNMLACRRSLRLMASGYRPLPLTESIESVFSSPNCPGELELPTPEGESAIYRLGEIRHQTITAYNHPGSGGLPGRHHLLLQTDKRPTGYPPVAKVKSTGS
ncbi:hypothetical protein DSO57_1010222 [Entomophthora muscae]|uniref:Uncharacterized protein n=1 Tax=Entomophthora muscae TaxID=34485 RepID=A0ACC2S8G5_9FUNG|nr:hypothetical protein DSO57_1010222 [Entomophthora muscae]